MGACKITGPHGNRTHLRYFLDTFQGLYYGTTGESNPSQRLCRHFGNHFAETFQGLVGDVWVMFGACLGSVWEVFGECLEDVWGVSW